MTYGNIARPYPETVEALEAKLREAEHEIEALRLRIQGLQQTIEHQATQDGERIAALRQRVDSQAQVFRNLLDIARRQSTRIRELEAEVERLKADHARTRAVYDAGFGWKDGRCAGQHDLPPTRAETDANEEPTP